MIAIRPAALVDDFEASAYTSYGLRVPAPSASYSATRPAPPGSPECLMPYHTSRQTTHRKPGTQEEPAAAGIESSSSFEVSVDCGTNKRYCFGSACRAPLQHSAGSIGGQGLPRTHARHGRRQPTHGARGPQAGPRWGRAPVAAHRGRRQARHRAASTVPGLEGWRAQPQPQRVNPNSNPPRRCFGFLHVSFVTF